MVNPDQLEADRKGSSLLLTLLHFPYYRPRVKSRLAPFIELKAMFLC